MQIFADENMPLVQQFFAELGNVTLINGRNVTAKQVKQADILLVRSVTNVDERLLGENNQLKFVGTATIGTDHVDTEYLNRKGIAFSSAPGCNAQSVVEYVLSSLWILAERYQWQLSDKTIGIVGVGNIGSRLALALKALNMKVLLCDPLRAEQEPGFVHTPVETLFATADIISFHVPQNKETVHYFNEAFLNQCVKPFYLLNLSRGKIVDTSVLVKGLKSKKIKGACLDVLEYEKSSFESFFDQEHSADFKYILNSEKVVMTPHVAGWTNESYFKLSNVLADKITAYFSL